MLNSEELRRPIEFNAHSEQGRMQPQRNALGKTHIAIPAQAAYQLKASKTATLRGAVFALNGQRPTGIRAVNVSDNCCPTKENTAEGHSGICT